MAQTPIRKLNGQYTTADVLTNKLGQIVDSANIIGMSVLIINDNKVAYQQFFGTKNKNTNAKFDDNTVSYAASLTKPLFTFLFLKLVEAKIFELDTPVFKYLKKPISEYPKWADLASQADFNKITPRMLLSHSSGLPILRYLPEYGDTLKITTPPGTFFQYSNEGMNFLGFVVEEVMGKNLQILTKSLIFDPLSMKRSGMIWDTTFNDNFSVAHDKDGVVIGAQKKPNTRAAGSLVTTPMDFASFIIELMEKKGLSKTLYDDMFKPQIMITTQRQAGPLRLTLSTETDKTQNSWGLGWALHQSPYGQAFRHGGYLDGWRNYCVAYPSQKTAIIILSNSDNFERMGRKILNLCIGDIYSPFDWMGYSN